MKQRKMRKKNLILCNFSHRERVVIRLVTKKDEKTLYRYYALPPGETHSGSSPVATVAANQVLPIEVNGYSVVEVPAPIESDEINCEEASAPNLDDDQDLGVNEDENEENRISESGGSGREGSRSRSESGSSSSSSTSSSTSSGSNSSTSSSSSSSSGSTSNSESISDGSGSEREDTGRSVCRRESENVGLSTEEISVDQVCDRGSPSDDDRDESGGKNGRSDVGQSDEMDKSDTEMVPVPVKRAKYGENSRDSNKGCSGAVDEIDWFEVNSQDIRNHVSKLLKRIQRLNEKIRVTTDRKILVDLWNDCFDTEKQLGVACRGPLHENSIKVDELLQWNRCRCQPGEGCKLTKGNEPPATKSKSKKKKKSANGREGVEENQPTKKCVRARRRSSTERTDILQAVRREAMSQRPSGSGGEEEERGDRSGMR